MTEIEIPDNLSTEIELAVYRIAQESLANIEKHAEAQHVAMRLQHSHEEIVFVVQDDGKGFDPAAINRKNGLLNLEQRVREIGGRIDIQTGLFQGTRIEAVIPLSRCDV